LNQILLYHDTNTIEADSLEKLALFIVKYFV
jgi:hypothetical protein